MQLFALRHKKTKKLADFSTMANEGDFCCSVSFSLSYGGNNIWTTTRRENAEKVAKTDNDWFNAEYDSPENSYVGEWDVVVFELKD